MITPKTRCFARVAWLMPVGVLSLTTAARAFSGEDPLNGNPFYHEQISHQAAVQAGWKTETAEPPFRRLTDTAPDRLEAGETIAWHADYIDSYLYSPIWWAQGGFDRYKVSKATQKELEKLHFDDLFTTEKVNAAWQRYAAGTFAGLLWAKEKNDVAAAQHLIGVSLHAMQDFYSHSNWIDDPARRTQTYTSTLAKDKMALFTGSYEHAEHLGQKTHGKWLPDCTIINQPGVSAILSLGCDGLPGLINKELCETFRACQKGEAVRPSISGVKLPPGIMYLAPPGIALDNTWVANLAVRERGLTDLTGIQAFNLARELAKSQSHGWLLTLEREMAKIAGSTEFWNRVKTTPTSLVQRTDQFEKYGQLPFLFLSAGPYPPVTSGPDIYLRVRLKTSGEQDSGTDADIRLRTDKENPGEVLLLRQEFLLDYLPYAGPILSYNDFERGDDDAYVVGPFDRLPEQIELYNDSASAGEIFSSFSDAIHKAISKAVEGVGDFFQSLIAGHADHIATTKKTWMPNELEAMGFGAVGEQKFAIDLNGGGEGHHRVHGMIRKLWEEGAYYWFEVRLDRLECLRETKGFFGDRGSDSDEPFILTVLSPLPGDNQDFRTQPFDDVDKGEVFGINHKYKQVRLPKSSGMLNLAISAIESDDESSATRDKLLANFAGRIDTNTAPVERGLIDTLGTAIAADWKVEHLEVFAWSRTGTIHTGKVFDAPVNRWIKGRSGATFELNGAAFRSSGISTSNLLNPVYKIDQRFTPPPRVFEEIPRIGTPAPTPPPKVNPVPVPLPRPIPRPVPRVLPR